MNKPPEYPNPINMNPAATLRFWLRRPTGQQETRIEDVRWMSPDFIKISVAWASPIEQNSESFWCKVKFIAADPLRWIDGEIVNDLKGEEHHGLRKGDVIRAYAYHVIDTEYIPASP